MVEVEDRRCGPARSEEPAGGALDICRAADSRRPRGPDDVGAWRQVLADVWAVILPNARAEDLNRPFCGIPWSRTRNTDR